MLPSINIVSPPRRGLIGVINMLSVKANGDYSETCPLPAPWLALCLSMDLEVITKGLEANAVAFMRPCSLVDGRRGWTNHGASAIRAGGVDLAC